MFCPMCGKELYPNARFCMYCGAKLEAVPNSPAKEETSFSNQAKKVADDLSFSLTARKEPMINCYSEMRKPVKYGNQVWIIDDKGIYRDGNVILTCLYMEYGEWRVTKKEVQLTDSSYFTYVSRLFAAKDGLYFCSCSNNRTCEADCETRIYRCSIDNSQIEVKKEKVSDDFMVLIEGDNPHYTVKGSDIYWADSNEQLVKVNFSRSKISKYKIQVPPCNYGADDQNNYISEDLYLETMIYYDGNFYILMSGSKGITLFKMQVENPDSMEHIPHKTLKTDAQDVIFCMGKSCTCYKNKLFDYSPLPRSLFRTANIPMLDLDSMVLNDVLPYSEDDCLLFKGLIKENVIIYVVAEGDVHYGPIKRYDAFDMDKETLVDLPTNMFKNLQGDDIINVQNVINLDNAAVFIYTGEQEKYDKKVCYSVIPVDKLFSPSTKVIDYKVKGVRS